MKSNVVKLKTGYRPPANPDVEKAFFAGLAAGWCDCHRSGGEYAAEIAARESGLDLSHFRQAGVDEYDLETLEEIYQNI